MTRPLGLVPGKSSVKVVRLDLVRHVTAAAKLVQAPDAINLLRPWPTLTLGHNDTEPDCGFVGLANALFTQACREGRRAAFASLSPEALADAVRDLWLQFTGGQHVGVVLLDVLSWLSKRADGFLGEPVGQPIAVNVADFAQVKFCLGVAQTPIYVGGPIDQGFCDAAPGTFIKRTGQIAGGHCRVWSGYITGPGQSFGEPNISEETWGYPLYETLTDANAQTDEGFILRDKQRSTSAFDLDTLDADLATL